MPETSLIPADMPHQPVVFVFLMILAGLMGWWLRGVSKKGTFSKFAFLKFSKASRTAGRVGSRFFAARGGAHTHSTGGGFSDGSFSQGVGAGLNLPLSEHPGIRVILHIGMPKSGTSALQNTLRANRDLLLKHGILYPAGGDLPKNHNILIAALAEENQLPRIFRQVYQNEPGKRFDDVRKVVATIADRARKSKVHTVILSGEMLFTTLSDENGSQLRSMLLSIGSRISVVAYIRHPAKHYLSMAQQAIKASSRIPSPKGRGFRNVLESYSQVGDEMIVNGYERELLHAGDITQDFCRKVLGVGEEFLKAIATVRSNETMSAEGMDILQRYRKHACAGKNGVFTADANLVEKITRRTDPEVIPFGRPELRREIEETIVRSAVDLPWLRDVWKIEFDGVDYDMPFKADKHAVVPRSVDEICILDGERRDRLLFLILKALVISEAGEEVVFKTAMPDRKS